MPNTPTLFPFRHDWAEPFRVTREYRTDIQTADDGTEVRVQLRSRPNISFTMHCVFLNSAGAGRLLSQWRSATRPLLYYAPLWCDTTELTSAVTAGDASIALDTTDRPFFDLEDTGVGYALLFRDQDHAEVVSYTAVDTASLTLAADVVASYAVAGTRVIPVRPMWLTVPVDVVWATGQIASTTLSFSDLKPQAGFGYAGASAAAVPASIEIRYEVLGSGGPNHDVFAEAVVYDALDQPIPDAQVTWTPGSDTRLFIGFNTRFVRIAVDSPDSGTVIEHSGSVSSS